MNKNKKNLLGDAKIHTYKLVAGSTSDFSITYTVGSTGIADGGVIKILTRISSDMAEVQFEDSNKQNYVELTTSAGCHLAGYSRLNGFKGKLGVRPWTNGFMIFIKEGYLLAGEKVQINFKQVRVQTIYEETFEFKFLVDPYATGEFKELKSSPEIEIIPDKPARLVAIAPTTVRDDSGFRAIIKLEDQWGNPCIYTKGKFLVKNFKELGLRTEKINFEAGIAQINVPEQAPALGQGSLKIKAKYQELECKANPARIIPEDESNQYWADLHGQSEETVGTNSLDFYINFAKKYALLNVITPQSNDFQVADDFWERTKQLAVDSQADNFVMLLGYEWSGNSGVGGDRNVIYKGVNEDIFRSSFAQIDSTAAENTECGNADKLFAELKKSKEGALTIAHVGGRYANLDFHDTEIERLIEVHSDWGTFEWFLHDALERGYKVGIVANSDNHNARPGASYPGFEEFGSYGGLTCILAKELTREAIFESLNNRKCFATTGVRVYLNAKLEYSSKKLAEIGEELPEGSVPRQLKLDFAGTDSVEKVTLYNKSQKVSDLYNAPTNRRFIKVSWQGTELKGRRREHNWHIKGSLQNNKIKKLEKCSIYNPSHKVDLDKESFEIESFTTGNAQSIIIETESKGGTLVLAANQQSLTIDLASLKDEQKMKLGEETTLTVAFASTKDATNMLNLEYDLSKIKLQEQNSLYLKVTQRDGHITWTSPWFI